MSTPRSRARQKARVVSIRSLRRRGGVPTRVPLETRRRATRVVARGLTSRLRPHDENVPAFRPRLGSPPLAPVVLEPPDLRLRDDAVQTRRREHQTHQARADDEPGHLIRGRQRGARRGRASAPGRRPRAGRARARRSHRNARRVHVAVTSPEVFHRRRLSTRRPDARPTERRRRSRETLLKEGRLRPRPSPHFTRAAALPRVLPTRHRRLTPLAPPRWPDSATWRASVPRSPIATAAGRKRETTPTTRILTCVPANPRVSA